MGFSTKYSRKHSQIIYENSWKFLKIIYNFVRYCFQTSPCLWKFVKIFENYLQFVLTFKLSPCLWKWVKIFENYLQFVLDFKLSPCLWKFFKIFENYLKFFFVLVFKLSPYSKCCTPSFGTISPGPLNFMCRRFGTRCQVHLPAYTTTYDVTECSDKSAHKIHPKAITQQFFSLFLELHANFAILYHRSELDAFWRLLLLAVWFCSWIMT